MTPELRALIERKAEEYSGVEFGRWCNNGKPSLSGVKRETMRDAFLAGAELLATVLGEYETTLKTISRHLDGIKYDLEASVYTLTDDEFEAVFYARDIADKALSAGRRILEGKC